MRSRGWSRGKSQGRVTSKKPEEGGVSRGVGVGRRVGHCEEVRVCWLPQKMRADASAGWAGAGRVGGRLLWGLRGSEKEEAA